MVDSEAVRERFGSTRSDAITSAASRSICDPSTKVRAPTLADTKAGPVVSQLQRNLVIAGPDPQSSDAEGMDAGSGPA